LLLIKVGLQDAISGTSFFTHAAMPSLVWMPWAPPNCKTFTWLIIQNRAWTTDRLERRVSQIVDFASYAAK
jgi:hypothetical protein